MTIEQLAELADKVLDLTDTFNTTFNPRNEEERKGNLKLAIMAGLYDAYNKGRADVPANTI